MAKKKKAKSKKKVAKKAGGGGGMKPWESGHDQYYLTYIYLDILNEIDNVYKHSAGIKMSEMAFWNKASSTGLRKRQAERVALELDSSIRVGAKVDLQTGQTSKSARQAMVKVLVDGNKTLKDLGHAVGQLYIFLPWKG